MRFRFAFVTGALAAAVLMLGLRPAASMPRLMDLYNEHPRALPQYKDKCVICHVNADGSGPLTHFGERYERVGLRYSEPLLAEFPNLFAAATGAQAKAVAASTGQAANPGPPSAGTAAGTAAVNPGPPSAGAAGPATTVPAISGIFEAPKYYRAECTKCHGKYADGDPLQGVPAFATPKWVKERLPQTEELLLIIMKGKDKMVGQEGKITEEQGRQLLDYVKAIAIQYGS